MMDSYKNCIEWLKNLDCSDMDYKERVINRMEYEHKKTIPAPVRFRKGQYGKPYANDMMLVHVKALEDMWRWK